MAYPSNTSVSIDSDLLRGAHAIGVFNGCTDRQAVYMCEKGHIPAFKIGNIWHARISTLNRFYAELEAASTAGGEDE